MMRSQQPKPKPKPNPLLLCLRNGISKLVALEPLRYKLVNRKKGGLQKYIGYLGEFGVTVSKIKSSGIRQENLIPVSSKRYCSLPKQCNRTSGAARFATLENLKASCFLGRPVAVACDVLDLEKEFVISGGKEPFFLTSLLELGLAFWVFLLTIYVTVLFIGYM
ncbi:hypothetical protein V6N12_060167 [Hibiscus sabdariffa]|uniref:Uncharacterized protein n=1 Tax=Hibiscus sabdariffa TaxID=183260 RepID=A0ABR2D3M9_9ROSI